MPRKKDPAVEWLSNLVAPLSPTEYLYKQAHKLLVESDQFNPPFYPRRALPASVKQVETAKISRDGMLIPMSDGFIIKINSDRPKVRQHFACAHEIGHTFFFDTSSVRPWRPYESMSSYWAEEDLCYQFAEEMLMPHLIIQEDTSNQTPSISNLNKLQKRYQVSVEAMLRRISRLNLWYCISIILQESTDNPNVLKRKWIGKHRQYRYYSINWDWLLSKGSSPYLALENPGILKKSIISCRDLFHRGKRNGQCSIESFRSTATNRTNVICIITLLE